MACKRISLNCAYMHWHRTNTGKLGFSLSNSATLSGSISNCACNWNFSPCPSSATHQITLRLAAFHTPPEGDVVNESPRISGGTPIIIVRSVRLSRLAGLELIWRATRQNPPFNLTLVCTRCSRIQKSSETHNGTV